MLKLSNEVKVAILALVAVSLAIWGFKFLKGVNLLTPSNIYYVKYNRVDQLRTSSPVYIKGFQVGMVKDVYIDPADDSTIVAVLNLHRDIEIPKDAEAVIVSQSIMGGKAVDLVFHHSCEGAGCAESGDYLKGSMRTTLESLIGSPKEMDLYTARIKAGLTINMDSLAKANPESFAGSLVALDNSIRNIEMMTSKLNRFLDASTGSFVATADNAKDVSGMLKASGGDIQSLITNLKDLSAQLKSANLDQSAKSATVAIDSITASLSDLRQTLVSTNRTISHVDTLAQGLISGKGSAGKMLTDEKLYDNLVRLSYQLELISQDLRLHPDRYTKVKVKLLGKNKVARYDYPFNDPAFQSYMDSVKNSQVYPPKQ